MSSLRERIERLCGPDERLLGFARADTTDEGTYFLTVRAWPHPDAEGHWTVSLRYAYLTKGDGSDGWVGGEDSSKAAGINMRVEGDPRGFMNGLGALFRGSAETFPQGEAWMGDFVDLGE